ncbi:hypothetical protein HYU13_06195 [Candidatus Woesearchaeota archaeon]|nr:hypothetical protein [Candidatus Woesearchaeota archaeon]
MKAHDAALPQVKQLLAYARRHVSPYIYLSSLDQSRSVASLGLQIQDVIVDHGKHGSTLRFIPLDNVISVQWIPAGRKAKFEGLSRRNFVKRARDRYSQMVEHSQIALLPSLYSKLVSVPEVSLSMSPLRKILMSVEERGSIAPAGLARGPEAEVKAQRYFSLLTDLGYIELEDSYYVPSKGMKNLQANKIRPPELYERILGDVIRKRSKYLQEVLHWTMMVPYLRWSNTYYFTAYEAGYLVRVERDDFVGNYRRFYGTKHDELTEMSQIQRIVDAGALKREDRYYEGKQKILDEFSSRADEEVALEPLRVGIPR